MRIEELVNWENRGPIKRVLESDLKDALREYIDIRLLNEEDRVELFFKKESIDRIMTNRIEGIVSLLSIGDFDDLVRVARSKVAIDSSIDQLDKELQERIDTKGLESLIRNFSL